jgi:hypothetical protein
MQSKKKVQEKEQEHKKKLMTQVIIRNSQWIDFARAVVGIIALVILAFIFLSFGIDGYLMYLIVTYIAFICGLGWGLFVRKRVGELFWMNEREKMLTSK